MRIGEYETHPAADCFDLIEGDEFASLCESLRQHGLIQSILLDSQGRIADGRNRYSACLETGVLPRFEQSDLEHEALINYIVAVNKERRHLTATGKSNAAAKLLPVYEEAARERQREAGEEHGRGQVSANGREAVEEEGKPKEEKGKAAKAAAKATGASERSVERNKAVRENGCTELIEALDQELVAVGDAEHALGASHEDQADAVQRVRDKKAKTLKHALRDIKRERQVLAARSTVAPTGEYNVIVVDPPWQYAGSDKPGDGTWRGLTPYPTMTIAEICEHPMPTADDCILWLWTTNTHLPQVPKVLSAWGFDWRTMLTWVKPKIGNGLFLRAQTEHCVVAFKGKPTHDRPGALSTVLHAPVGEHSAKPDSFYELVEKLCPGSKAELFSRQPRLGWVAFGSETEGAISV